MTVSSNLPGSSTRPGRHIGLFGVPFDRGASTRGTAMGPHALRISGMAETLVGLGHRVADHGDVTVAAAASGIAAQKLTMAEMATTVDAIHDRALDILRAGQLPLCLGGDHSVSMGSVGAVQRHCAEMGRDLVVLWLDAHADFNTPLSTPSGNMHGMPVAFLCGDDSLADLRVRRPFPPIATGNVHLFGLRSIDRDERRMLKARGLKCFDMRLIDEFGVSALMRDILGGLDRKRTHLHLSFDLDALDPAIAPGVGTPVQGGISYREAHLIMELLHDSSLVGSVDVVEVNPYLDDRGATARLATEMIGSLFGRSILER